MNIPQQMKSLRKILKENQTDFGKRFDVSSTAVSLWEKGEREAPYKVIEFIFNTNRPKLKRMPCEVCEGKGFILAQMI